MKIHTKREQDTEISSTTNNQKLLRIVDDVLMLSKIESDDINFKYTTVDIADFFKKLIDKIRPLVGPNVQLICKCDKPLTSTLDVTLSEKMLRLHC